MNHLQMEAAKKAVVDWLADPREIGGPPAKIEYTKDFDLHGLRYYIFRFKKGLFGGWLLGVCGGYEGNELEHCGHIFSEMERYDERTSVESCTKMVEKIRTYWIQQAAQHERSLDLSK